MKRKNIRLLSLFLTLLVIIPILSSCGDLPKETEEYEETESHSESISEGGEVEIPELHESLQVIKNGECDFCIVIPKDSHFINDMAAYLIQNAIKLTCGDIVTVDTDFNYFFDSLSTIDQSRFLTQYEYEASGGEPGRFADIDKMLGEFNAPSRYEILIGETDREESARAIADLEKENEYMLRIDGNKIVLVASSDSALMAGARYLVSEYFSAKKTDVTVEDLQQKAVADASSPKDFLEEANCMQIIPDLDFKKGIELLSQKDHSNGDRISVLDIHDFYGGSVTAPVWRLAQWDSGPCLVENRVQSVPTIITDGIGRSFAYEPNENKMTFELDTSLYYQGNSAVSGDYWPHLLIEQGQFLHGDNAEAEEYLSCDADRLILTFDIRLTGYEETPIEGDWVRAAQFLMYFYVTGKETNDFCWFGVQLFDNRSDKTSNYIGYDGGKADASGAMIYSIGSRYVYQNSGRTLYLNGCPDTSGEWVHVKIDLKPYLEDMLKSGAKDGYFKADSLSELYINGMNMGWETIATFDHTMEVRNLQLWSCIGD